MQAARPSLQIEAYRYACVQICPMHCVRIAILNLVESKPILKVGTRSILNLVLNLVVHRQAHMVETPSHFKLHTVPLGNI